MGKKIKVTMEFDREIVETMVAMARNVFVSELKKMTDEELVKKAFEYGPRLYGFRNMEIIEITED
jgi:hypothetical protein